MSWKCWHLLKSPTIKAFSFQLVTKETKVAKLPGDITEISRDQKHLIRSQIFLQPSEEVDLFSLLIRFE